MHNNNNWAILLYKVAWWAPYQIYMTRMGKFSYEMGRGGGVASIMHVVHMHVCLPC
jgi:hypothetical protein